MAYAGIFKAYAKHLRRASNARQVRAGSVPVPGRTCLRLGSDVPSPSVVRVPGPDTEGCDRWRATKPRSNERTCAAEGATSEGSSLSAVWRQRSDPASVLPTQAWRGSGDRAWRRISSVPKERSRANDSAWRPSPWLGQAGGEGSGPVVACWFGPREAHPGVAEASAR